MSQNSSNQGTLDARDNKQAADVSKEHWKVQEDYNAAYAREKEKQNR